MAKKTVTIYIDDNGIRLLECKGDSIRKWVELPLQPGQIEGAVITAEAEVASQLRQLLKDHKIRAKKVIVGLSGLHCLTRPIVLPQLPKAMVAEAVIREARRLLPAPPEQLYISWQSLPAPEGKTHIFLVAVPRRTADALLKTLLLAKLKPHIMGIKPLAMASLVREDTAIIVDVQPTEFDIVIMVDGIPQPIRTVSFPEQVLSWEDKVSILISDLDRTIKFYNSNSPDTPVNSSVPLYVSGEIANQPESCEALSNKLGYAVSILESPMKGHAWLDPSRFLVNVGLALQEPSLGKMTGPSVAKSNLLPAEYQPKPISWGKVVALPGAVVVVGLIIPFVIFISDTSANIASESEQLSLANRVLTEKQLQKRELAKDIKELEKQLVEVETSLETFTLALDRLNTQGDDINGNLEIIIDNLPKLIQLNSIECSPSALTITGLSPSETEVLSYARSLNNSGRFSQTTIASVARTDTEEMNFTLVITK